MRSRDGDRDGGRVVDRRQRSGRCEVEGDRAEGGGRGTAVEVGWQGRIYKYLCHCCRGDLCIRTRRTVESGKTL